ncbi:MAG: hypothetical protein Q7S20_05880 [Gemmatimonadaceae bacterium]|nr:hypothetical protein [Gemmatimonadaceae bacterium]
MLAFLASPDPRLLVADTLTAQALRPAAQRRGYTISATSSLALCGGPAGKDQVTGLLVKLTLTKVMDDRAEVVWSGTCHITPRGESVPLPFGPIGVLEVRRIAGKWLVTRSLAYFDR